MDKEDHPPIGLNEVYSSLLSGRAPGRSCMLHIQPAGLESAQLARIPLPSDTGRDSRLTSR